MSICTFYYYLTCFVPAFYSETLVMSPSISWVQQIESSSPAERLLNQYSGVYFYLPGVDTPWSSAGVDFLRAFILDKLHVRGLDPPVVAGQVVTDEPVEALTHPPVPEVDVEADLRGAVHRVPVHAGPGHITPRVHGHLQRLVFLSSLAN